MIVKKLQLYRLSGFLEFSGQRLNRFSPFADQPEDQPGEQNTSEEQEEVAGVAEAFVV